MMYNGDAILGVSLTVDVPKPLDSRTVARNLTDIYSTPIKSAYEGMTVANLDNGNIYMLIDKDKIDSREGWKASYESILIITCTESEYKEWQSNTTEDYLPIDPEKDHLRSEAYYYIYESSINNKDLYYVSYGLFNLLQTSVLGQISNVLSSILKVKDELPSFAKAEEVLENYVHKDELDSSNPDSSISKILDPYLTSNSAEEVYLSKTDAETTYVTKESLRGGIEEGEDDFVFVTLTQYKSDKDALLKEFKSDSISTKSLTIDSANLTASPDGGLYTGEDKIAVVKDIPKMECMSIEDYQKEIELGTVKEDTYYYTYEDGSDTSYATKAELNNYYTKTVVDSLINSLKAEIAALKLLI